MPATSPQGFVGTARGSGIIPCVGPISGRNEVAVTYCLGILTRQGLVLASDSRTNAGYDDVNVCRKMHKFVLPGERAFILLCSGSLSLSQSVITQLSRDFEHGQGLATAATMYDA